MTTTTTVKNTNSGARRVAFHKTSNLEIPMLYLAVHVVGHQYDERLFAEMFVRAQCNKAVSIETADLVIFAGGQDVDPLLYGEKPHRKTHSHLPRDKMDMEAYDVCIKNGIPMLGICRGAQFLHVMNGGKLFQDVDGHYGDHFIWDQVHKRVLNKVSSVHHQLVRDNKEGGMEVIAVASGRSKTRWIDDLNYETGNQQDIEAFFYRGSCCLGIQGHPEYRNYEEFTKWSLDLVYEYIYENPDFDWTGKRFRMKKELLDEREAYREAMKNSKERN